MDEPKKDAAWAAKTAYDAAGEVDKAIGLFEEAEARYIKAAREAVNAARHARRARKALQGTLSATFRVAMFFVDKVVKP